MKLITVTILFFSVITAFTSNAQIDEDIDPLLIKLQARLLNSADSLPVPYANIINPRTHSGTITSNEGFFSIEMLNIDTLVVTSIGYQRGVIKVPANYTGYGILNFYLQPVNYALREVKVEGEKPKVDLGFDTGKPVNIAPELRGDAFNEAPPILAAIFNPASYLQYYLSKRERRKREVRREMVIQQNWELHSQNYNKEKVMMLTGLNDAQADSFMVWFNAQDVLPYLSTEYQIRATIIEYFNYYQIEKAMQGSSDRQKY